MKKSRRLALLMLPILVAYLFQATQYARAPVKYNFYVVYAKNADIALKPGSDKSPNGQTLLQNATIQQGLYNLTLGQWGPGYRINYTDAFNVTNREAFNVKMIAFNFSSDSTGKEYLRIYILNDTDYDRYGDAWVTAWNGTQSTISTASFIWFANASLPSDGGTSRVKIEINIDEDINDDTLPNTYTGTLYLWFTST